MLSSYSYAIFCYNHLLNLCQLKSCVQYQDLQPRDEMQALQKQLDVKGTFLGRLKDKTSQKHSTLVFSSVFSF